MGTPSNHLIRTVPLFPALPGLEDFAGGQSVVRLDLMRKQNAYTAVFVRISRLPIWTHLKIGHGLLAKARAYGLPRGKWQGFLRPKPGTR